MSTDYKHDMAMMLAFHDALRRELGHIARVTARRTDDPRHVMATAAGWQMFKNYLHVHHGCEDDVLWPALEKTLADRPDDLALLAAMEAEHAAIDPLLTAIDATLANPASGPERLGDLADALATTLGAHLRHEEGDALALIDATVTDEQWQDFGQEHGQRFGPEAPASSPGYLTAWTRPRPSTSWSSFQSRSAPSTAANGSAPTGSWTAGAPRRKAQKRFRRGA